MFHVFQGENQRTRPEDQERTREEPEEEPKNQKEPERKNQGQRKKNQGQRTQIPFPLRILKCWTHYSDMPRIRRIAIEEIPYHITQRGNARQQVFFTDADHQLYLDLLARHAAQTRLRVHAYCLMPNHIHLIATPERPESMPAALSRVHADFARHFNLQRRTCGHVWQARYFSCPLDRVHFWQALAYVERNPVRARLVQRAEDFRWSSACARLSGAPPPAFLDLSHWREAFTAEEWAGVLASGPTEIEFGERLAEAGIRGRPLGDAEFLAGLESLAGRRLRAKPVGRPKQVAPKDQAQMELEIGIR